MGKCKNLRTVTVTSVCCFTRLGLIQEHNPLAHKALMYIQDTMDCAYCGWESMNKIMIPFVVAVIYLWHTNGAMNLLVNTKLNADITRKPCYFTFYMKII